MDLVKKYRPQLLQVLVSFSPLMRPMAARELLRFLQLKSESGSQKNLSPGPVVDRAWHDLILETSLYAQICNDLLGCDELIEHSQLSALDSIDQIRKRYQATYDLLGDEDRDPYLWPSPADCYPETETEPEPEERSFNIFLRDTDGRKHVLQVDRLSTVYMLKKMYMRLRHLQSFNNQVLYLSHCSSPLMVDDQLLTDAGLHNNSSVDVLVKLRGC
jgi:hypothetical protein